MTEEEAKKKVCYRTVSGELAGAVTGSFKPKPSKCLGSECMAWTRRLYFDPRIGQAVGGGYCAKIGFQGD